ncbi:hypothetical protein HDU67_004571, partial [Dinochytrium kinnereticum]
PKESSRKYNAEGLRLRTIKLAAQQKGMMKSTGNIQEKPLTPEADPRAIFIGNLPYSISEQQLKSALL